MKARARLRGAALILLMMFSVPASAASVNTEAREVVALGDGVWAIRHPDAPDGFPQGTTTVIAGEREVMVVDSCYLPSSAREDIEQIREWTAKPVRWLVNTHWHYDHTMGNGEYAAAFPEIQIVAHEETRRHIAGYNPGWFQRYPKATGGFARELETGADADGNAITPERRELLEQIMPGRAPVAEEFALISDRPPTMSFRERLVIDLGDREVQLLFLGRGNTTGDTVVFLPKERIMIAGDLLDYPVPYLGGGYPVDLVRTLGRMKELEPQTIVPGHGEVLHDTEHLENVRSFVAQVVDATSRAIYRIGNGPRHLERVREEVKSELDLEKYRQMFGGDDEDSLEFFEGFSLDGVVTAAYAQLWGR